MSKKQIMTKKSKTAKPQVRLFVIQEMHTPETDEILYWNNECGYTTLASATVFTETECAVHQLPMHGTWIELPQLPNLEVVVRVSGGVAQSAIGNYPIAVDVFDIDNRENFTDAEIDNEWNALKKTHPIGLM